MSQRAHIAQPDDPISEKEVLDNYAFLSVGMLLKARNAGKISWVEGKRHSVWYRPSAIRAYIAEELEKKCPAPGPIHSSNSADNGSPTSPEAPSTTDSGLSQEVVELAARRCAQKI